MSIDLEALELRHKQLIAGHSDWSNGCYSVNAADMDGLLSLARQAQAAQQAPAQEGGDARDKPEWRDLPGFVSLLKRALEELRLIRMKDSGAVYDTLIRLEIAAVLDAYAKDFGDAAIKSREQKP